MRLSFVTILATALLAGACAGRQADPAAGQSPPEAEPRVYDDRIFEELSPEALERYQPDLRLAAFQEVDGALTVYVRNETERTLTVTPADFGLIVEGKLHPLRPGMGLLRFPVARLEPQGMATGRLRLHDFDDLEGQFLVCRHPELRPSRCRIRGPLE